MRRREIDAAIVTEPLIPEPELDMLPILTEPLIVVAPPGAPVTDWQSALTTLPFLSFNKTSGMARIIDAAIREAGLVVSEAMELDSSAALLGLAHAGLGAGVVPAGQLKDASDDTVKTFPFGDPPISRRVVLIEPLNYARTDLSQVLYLELQRLTGSGA